MIQTNFEIKKSNTLKFFLVLREADALSRRELEELTGLSWGSISSISSELLQKELIIAKKDTVTTGRPPDRLMIHPYAHLSLGIDINSIGLSFNVVNLAGKSVYSVFSPLQSNYKDDLLALLRTETEKISRKFRLTSINLAMQGKIDRQSGVSIRTNFFEGWKDIPIVRFFENEFGIPTHLYHDPEALLNFHLRTDLRLKKSQNGFVIRLDDGIGMAQLVDGKIYDPGNNANCEIGHLIVSPNGRPCPCGKNGCLETYSSIRGMKNAYTSGEKEISTEEFLAILNNRKDERANAILDEACRYLGIALANIFTLLSPSFVLLDGILPTAVPGLFSRVQQETSSFLHSDCNLLRAFYQRDAAAIGSCMLTTDSELENILFREIYENH